MATVEIDLWGEKIRLSSAQDDEFVKRVAEYLNDKMKEVQANDTSLLTTKILALRASFMIAAEYMLIKQQVGELDLAVDDILLQIEQKLKRE